MDKGEARTAVLLSFLRLFAMFRARAKAARCRAQAAAVRRANEALFPPRGGKSPYFSSFSSIFTMSCTVLKFSMSSSGMEMP